MLRPLSIILSNIGSSSPCARSLSAPICCLSSPAWVRSTDTARRLGQGQKLWDAVMAATKTQRRAHMYMYTCTCMYMHMVYVYACVCMYMSMVYTYSYVHVCVYICISISISISIFISISISISISIHMYIYIYIFSIYVYISIYMYSVGSSLSAASALFLLARWEANPMRKQDLAEIEMSAERALFEQLLPAGKSKCFVSCQTNRYFQPPLQETHCQLALT